MLDCFGQFLIGAHVAGSISAAFSQLTTAAPCLHSPQEALRDTKATAARPGEALPQKTALDAISADANKRAVCVADPAAPRAETKTSQTCVTGSQLLFWQRLSGKINVPKQEQHFYS